MDKKGVSKKVICWIILISVLVILIVVLAFGLLINKKDDTVDEYNPGVITMSYTDSNTFKFTNLVPLTDSLGKTSEQYFDFVVNTKLEDSDEINYEIAVSIIEDESNVTGDMIKFYLEKQNSGSFSKVFGPSVFKGLNKSSKLSTPAGSMVLLEDTKKRDSVDNYRLRVFLDEKSTVVPDNVYYVSVKVDVFGKDK